MSNQRGYDELVAEAECAVADVVEPEQRQAAFKRVLATLLAAHTPSTAQGTSADTLRKIAMEQKALMYCLLVGILLAVAQRFSNPEHQLTIFVSMIVTSVALSMLLFVLAKRLFNVSIAATLALLGLIPIVGVAILLFVNRKAMKVLRSHGIAVGFMGAKTSQIPVAP